jgi:hypothetical protein
MKVYSPTQVALSTFLGGPIAMVYVLKKNFEVLENKRAAQTTVIWGSLLVALVVLILPFLPEQFPNLALPLAYGYAARMVAEKYQLSKGAIVASDRFEFQSNWKVFGVSIGLLAAFVVLVGLWVFGLQAIAAS